LHFCSLVGCILFAFATEAFMPDLARWAAEDGSASPVALLWDNGTDAGLELNRILEVRREALARLSPDAIRPGAPSAQPWDTLVPLYLLHRFQTQAAIKMIGGLGYRYTVRGDGQRGPTIVRASEQRAALAAVVKTVSPEVLVLPENILRELPPGRPR
jgi:Met-zincin